LLASFVLNDKLKNMNMVLLSILSCPRCGGKLLFDQQEQLLLCHFDRLGFSISQGIPQLKLSQAFELKEEHL
jgi:uncharacterized protein